MILHDNSFLGIIQEHEPSSLAIVGAEHSWTFGQIVQRARYWRGLLAENIGRGEIVVCDYEDDPFEYVAKFVGVLAAGGVHFATREKYLTWDRIDSYQMPWSAIANDVPHKAGHKFLRYMIVAGDTIIKGPYASADKSTTGRPGRILETSGSTGESKWVFWLEQTLIADRREWIAELSLSRGDVILNLHSLDFAHGIDVHVLAGLVAGASVIHRSIVSDDIRGILDVIRRHKVTMVSALPYHFGTIATACEDPALGSSVRLALTGGTFLPPAMVAMVRDRTGMHLMRCYGATEVGVACGNFSDRDQTNPALRPLMNVSMRLTPLEGEIGRRFPNVGEPYFRCENMAAGYWGDDARTAYSFREGWYKSGDAVVQNADGSIAVLGRAEDVWINPSSGELVSAGEISIMLNEVPGVREVAVIPPAKEYTSKPTVFCTVASGESFDAVRISVSRCMSDAGINAKLYLSDDWPRTIVGKPERKALMAWARV